MAFGYNVHEPNVVDDYAILLSDGYGFGGISVDYPPFSEAIFYPCKVLDFDSPPLEDFHHHSVSSPFREANACSLSCLNEGEQPEFDTWRYWSSEYDSYLRLSDRWAEKFSSSHNGTCINVGHGNHLEKIEDAFLIEEQLDSFVSLNEYAESQLSWEECLSPGYESWLGYASDEDSDCCSRQEPLCGHTYCMDDLGICGSILCYWPCLMQEHPITDAE